jgi:hypothetical protein
MSNQAFAQHNSWYNDISSPHGQPGTSTDHNLAGMILGSHPIGESPAQYLAGKILGKAGLGDVCLSCFGH